MLGKRLINSNSAATPSGACTTDTLQILGDTSCIAYYKMSDATDESGNYDGTPSNVNFNVAGKFGNAAEFNGSNSNISVGNPIPNTDTDVTISAWINLSSGVSSNMHITGTGITTSGSEAPFRATLQYQSANTFRIFALRQVAGTYYLSPNSSLTNITINAGTWYHIAWSYTASGRKLNTFLNGVQIDTDVAMTTTGASVNDGSMIIGSFRTNTAFFNGKIDQVRIFNKELSSTEVTTLYDEVDCPCTTNTINYPTTNVAYYEFDGNAEDSTTNGYNGVYSNVTWAQGRYGTVGSFNGSSSYIQVANDSFNYTAMTFSVWVNPSANDAYMYIFQNGMYDSRISGTIGWYVRREAGGSLLARGFSSNSLTVPEFDITSSAGDIPLNTWTNVTCVLTPTSFNIYVDGNSTAVASATFTNSITYSANQPASVYIGTAYNYSNGAVYDYFFEGAIDQVRIFSSALSSTDVADLYDEQYCFDNFFNDDSTVATYKLNNTAFDDLGYYNGTASNITYETGKFDLAADFNGSSSKISFTSPIGNTNSTEDFTISTWINLNSIHTSGMVALFGNTVAGTVAPASIYLYGLGSGNIGFSLERGVGGNVLYAPNYTTDIQASMVANTWYNFVLVYDGSTAGSTGYLNGTLLNSTSSVLSTSAAQAMSTTQIMGVRNQSSNWFNGKIDQVRVFDRALDSGEVTQLYNE